MAMPSKIKGDLYGAASAAIITLPMSIGYGIIAFSGLGVDFTSSAALLGAYSAVISCFVAALLGGTPIQISGPKAPLTLAMGAVVTKLVIDTRAVSDAPLNPEVVIGLASFTVLIAGISQMAFGAVGMGSIVKYVPQPIVAGFMNGIAILLIVKQIKPLMGVDNRVSIDQILLDPSIIHGPTLITGLITIIAIVYAKGFIKRVPASVIGLGIGTSSYYLMISILGNDGIGKVIGHIQTGWPKPFLIEQFVTQFSHVNFGVFLPHLFISGLIIGLIGSMESLLSSVVSDNLTGLRHNSRKELIGQGAGNIVCSIFGALPNAGSIPRTIANYRAGGRTRLSGILCGVLILITITFCSPLIGKIPLAVISGIIIVVGYSLFNKWSLNLARKLFSSKGHRKAALTNLAITTIVTVLTVSINLIVAVIIGVIISSAIFISRIGKSIVRRYYTGEQFHSRKMRSKSQREVLDRMGRQIAIVELQGPLFFGSAEHLADKIDNLLANSFNYFILDMKRVNEIDSTGANIILRIRKMVELDNKYFLLSNVRENVQLWNFLDTMNVIQTLNMANIYPDTDSALEWAEDHLLQTSVCEYKPDGEVPLSQVDLLQNLSTEELETFNRNLVSLNFKKDDNIIAEGDMSRDLYLLKDGSVTVKIHLPEKDRNKRLYTYSPGIVFGEIAFLDGGCRSAGIWADEDSKVLQLPYRNFKRIQAEQPSIATKLVSNIALQLSQRMRRISDQMRMLEDQ